MKILTQIIIISCLVASCHSDQQSEPKVYGGTPVEDGAHTETVALAERVADGSFRIFCSGVIVDSEWVLTAGHCVKDFVERTELIGVVEGQGSDSDVNSSNNEVLPVSRILLHPRYLQASIGTLDAALIKVANLSGSPAVLDATPIDLMDHIEDEKEVSILGFGFREDRTAGIKVAATSKLLSLVADQFAVGGDGVDSCQGDSGGPILGQNNSLLGISSRNRSTGCGNGGLALSLPQISCWLHETIARPAPLFCRSIGRETPKQYGLIDECRHALQDNTSARSWTIRAIMHAASVDSCEEFADLPDRITELNLDHYQIQTASPLEHFANLRQLSLVNNSLRNLEFVSDLPDIRTLDIRHNFISSVRDNTEALHIRGRLAQGDAELRTTFLSSCTNLENLTEDVEKTVRAILWIMQTDDCQIANQRVFYSKSLRLNDRDLIDLSPLLGLVNLQSLELRNNSITDISAIASLESLELLDVTGNDGIAQDEIDALPTYIDVLVD